MITQRPVTGSLRSSGIERVSKYLHCWRFAVDRDRHNVEPARRVQPPATRQKPEGELHDPPLLVDRDRFAAVPERRTVPRFDFHEHDGGAVARDDVNFSTGLTPAAFEDFVPASFELATREIFACFPQRDARLCHAAEIGAKRRPVPLG